MKDYFKRLKSHPGIGTAVFVSVLGTLAGAGNKSFEIWQGAIFGFVFTSLIVWSIVLISNIKK